jgi:hypothetical protein
VLYVPWIRQWFAILCSQEDTSRVADLGHTEGALSAGGELVSTILSEHPLEHQIFHLQLSAMHKPLLVVFECLVVPCIFYSRLPFSLIDEVDIFTSELGLRGFVVCLDTYGAHGDFRGEDGLSPVYHEERRLSNGPAG